MSALEDGVSHHAMLQALTPSDEMRIHHIQCPAGFRNTVILVDNQTRYFQLELRGKTSFFLLLNTSSEVILPPKMVSENTEPLHKELEETHEAN